MIGFDYRFVSLDHELGASLRTKAFAQCKGPEDHCPKQEWLNLSKELLTKTFSSFRTKRQKVLDSGADYIKTWKSDGLSQVFLQCTSVYSMSN